MTHRAPILPLQVENLSFAAGGKRLIKDMTFSLEAGKSTVILGPNGAGKSLLLRLCHGLLTPSNGMVRWSNGGTDPDPKFAQAMVFQRPVMLRRSAGRNIEYALKLHGIEKAEREPLARQALQRMGLGRFYNHPARVLSFGEQQRLAIARAWALSPQVLFLDEPSASLDPAATHSIETAIEAIRDSGTKIIMTTHDLGQARRLADNVLFLHRGRLLEYSTAEAFFSGPRNDLAQAFIKGELLWWRKKELTPSHNHP